MLSKRVQVGALLLPIGLLIIALGGQVFTVTVALILAQAAWEYGQILRAGGYHPSRALLAGGALVLAMSRGFDGFRSAPWIISLLVLASLVYHMVAFERGRNEAGTDFGATLGGVFYIGWIGAYLVSLRTLPEGVWWLLLALPAVWIADSAAFYVGRRFGRRKLSPRLSPKKTWEGYLGGVVGGTLGAGLLAGLYGAFLGAGPAITIGRGLLLGLCLSILSTLGDLGESMFKRQMGVKDSGNLLPGHGGAFDRIDSWLWAGAIGYYLVSWVFY